MKFEIKQRGKTIYSIITTQKKEPVGTIVYLAHYKVWAFAPHGFSNYTDEALIEIIEFMKTLKGTVPDIRIKKEEV